MRGYAPKIVTEVDGFTSLAGDGVLLCIMA